MPMFHVLNTIVPIFFVILLGGYLRHKEYLPSLMIKPLNQLVYYLAIPAMIFRELAEAPFGTFFHPQLLAGTLVPVIVVFCIALVTAGLWSLPPSRRGTFLQSSIHGNLGYIGLAVAYYFLGKDGFSRAGILAGFLMLLQNLLAVLGLQVFQRKVKGEHRLSFFLKKIMGNPVIISALAGILFSVLEIPLPEMIDRILKIISAMALPLALLSIGATLSLNLLKSHLSLTLVAGFFKLLALPALGLLVFMRLDVPTPHFLPAIILLASPTATVTYVMAGEMNGSPDLATAAISLTTLMSCVTFVFWLGLL